MLRNYHFLVSADLNFPLLHWTTSALICQLGKVFIKFGVRFSSCLKNKRICYSFHREFLFNYTHSVTAPPLCPYLAWWVFIAVKIVLQILRPLPLLRILKWTVPYTNCNMFLFRSIARIKSKSSNIIFYYYHLFFLLGISIIKQKFVAIVADHCTCYD